MKNILLLRLSALGDLTHCLPLYHSLNRKYPKAVIHWVVDKNFADLLLDLPQIKIHRVNKSNLTSLIQSSRKIKRELANHSIDIFINVHDSISAHLVSLFLPKPNNKKMHIGLAREQTKEFQYLFVANSVNLEQRMNQHAVDQALNCLKPLNIKPFYCFDLKPKKNILEKEQPTQKNNVLINLSTSKHHLEKALNENIYLEIFNFLIEKFAKSNHEIKVHLSGMNDEISMQLAEKLIKMKHLRKGNFELINWVGKTHLNQWLDLVAKSDFIISPDSAVVHLADLYQIPCLSIYLATNPKKVGPYQNQMYCLDFYQSARNKLLNQNDSWDKRIHHKQIEKFIDSKKIIQTLESALDKTKIG